jgi:hypothetical protein
MSKKLVREFVRGSTAHYFISSLSDIEVLHSYLQHPKANASGERVELSNGSF